MINNLFIFGAKNLYLFAVIPLVICLWRLPNKKRKELIIFSMVALVVIFVISRIASQFYFDPRPFVANHFMPLIPHAADNGFPSDHVLILSAIASIIFPFDKKNSLAVWLIAILVGISRVYVGIHHPIDIAGSILISISFSLIVHFGLKKIKLFSEPKK